MKRILLLLTVTAVIFLALSGVAYAASPQSIYNDYRDHGRLEGTYTDAELNAYLNSALVHQYGETKTLTELDSLVRRILTSRDRFPFTGAEIGLLVFGVLAALGAGVGLRRVARARS